MTVTVNGRRPAVTVGDDVQMCVRPPDPADEASSGPVTLGGPRAGASHVARAIPGKIADFKGGAAEKIHNVVSLHAGEVLPAVQAAKTFTERPMTVADAWRQVTPDKGEVGSRLGRCAGTVAGVFRAVGLTALYVAALSIGSRIRAGVAFCLLVLVLSTAGIVSALT